MQSNLTEFTENKTILKIITDLKKLKEENPDKFNFSDVTDNEGNFYVDLVQEGGGVLGVSLLGYTYILEQLNIRFLKLGGTSAGAINALLMAAVDTPENPKTVKVLSELLKKDISEFVDGDKDVKNFVNSYNSNPGKLKLLFKGVQVIDTLKEHKGLNPGLEFERWLKTVLVENGIDTNEDLTKKMYDLPPEVLEKIYPDIKGIKKPYHLAIVAADITTETKAVLPEMGNLYFENIERVSPAEFVRASMSIPIFFRPMKVEIPQDEETKKRWINKAGYFGKHPQAVQFVDGGIISNFPINMFHVHDVMPKRPTFGVRLGFDRMRHNDINQGIISLLFTCFDTARLMSDREFIFNNEDFQHLVTSIDTKEHSWLNFNISIEDKVDLFIQGAKAAETFLKTFNWESYKKVRKAKALATIAQNDLEIDLPAMLKKVEEARKIEITESDEVDILINRLKFIPSLKEFNILWIDGKSRKERESLKIETDIVRTLIGKIEWVTNSNHAFKELEDEDVKYNLIVSDIERNGSKTAGLEFYKKAVELFFEKKISLPPIIFYIKKGEYSGELPPYVFGLTDSPVNLIHLMADVYQRSGPRVSPESIFLQKNSISFTKKKGLIEKKDKKMEE